jgi:hypothetical protein
VDKTTPPSYVSSKDYWFNPVPGYDKVSTPQPGDIAIYNGHGVYTDGHSAIYVDGRVFEQNADPDGSPAHLYTRANTYLLGYLRKQGVNMPDFSQEANDRQNALVQIAKEVSVDYKDLNDVNQVIANIRTQGANIDKLTQLCEDRLRQIETLQNNPPVNFTPYAGPPLFMENK